MYLSIRYYPLSTVSVCPLFQKSVGNYIQFYNHTTIVATLPSQFDSTSIITYKLNISIGSQTAFKQIGENINDDTNPLNDNTDSEKNKNEDDNNNTSTIIAAIVISIVGLIILVGASVVLLVWRKRRSSSSGTKILAPFVPMEKKDFIPLIYGDHHSLSSEEKRNAGDLAKLEQVKKGSGSLS